MKIQYASDLHLEFTENDSWLTKKNLIPKADILVLNGDIIVLHDGFENNKFFDYISTNFKQTYIIPGNHEFYGGFDMKDALTLDINIRPNVKLLNNQAIIINDTKFIFTTLWTKITDEFIKDYINDFHKSVYNNELLSVKNYNDLHHECVSFLEKELQKNTFEKTIVVTHHLPSKKVNGYISEYPIFNQLFIVNLDHLLEKYKIDYWLFGHSHTQKDCEFYGIKFRSNQLGYVRQNENPNFNQKAIIEI